MERRTNPNPRRSKSRKRREKKVNTDRDPEPKWKLSALKQTEPKQKVVEGKKYYW